MRMHSNVVTVSPVSSKLDWTCGQVRAWNHTLVRKVVRSGALERLSMSPDDVYGELAVVFARTAHRFVAADYCTDAARQMAFYKIASDNACKDIVKRAYRAKRGCQPIGESSGVDLDSIKGQASDPAALVDIPQEYFRVVQLVVNGDATTVTAACLSVGMSRSVAAAMKKKIENWAKEHATTA